MTTDFGLADAYVGTMKGVIYRINPDVRIVDLSHEVGPQNVHQAAFLLSAAWNYFPPGTIHVAVVDPGVGTERRAVAVSIGPDLFAGPDNGLLSYVLSQAAGRDVVAVELTNDKYWLQPVSATFHGRDIFAPVAAYLSLGIPLEELGRPADGLKTFPISHPERVDDRTVVAHVIYVDRFGNLVTDLVEADLAQRPRLIEAGEYKIDGVSGAYGDVKPGYPLAIVGSHGHMEVAVRDGHAESALSLTLGDRVIVRI